MPNMQPKGQQETQQMLQSTLQLAPHMQPTRLLAWQKM
jgi:hypothetical protein